MLASTYYDPVMGVDFHLVVIPGTGLMLVPMVFLGAVYDPKGLFVGAAVSLAKTGSPGLVLVNGLPATACGTGVEILFHHPPAPGFKFALGDPKNDATLWHGGQGVFFGGSFPVRLLDLALSCSDPLRLPTSLVMAYPKGRPVFVNRPMIFNVQGMVDDWEMGLALGLAGKLGKFMIAGLGRALRKGGSKLKSALADQLRAMKANRVRACKPTGECHSAGHPVDVVTGRLFTEAEDFRVGQVELTRHYDSSRSDRQTSADGAGATAWSKLCGKSAARWCAWRATAARSSF